MVRETTDYVEPDTQRHARLQFGDLVYQAKFDHEKLKCYYKIVTFPCCCGAENLARMTTMDLTTTAMHVMVPSAIPLCSCCAKQPLGSFAFYNHSMFSGSAVKGELCGPYPHCCTDRVPTRCCCFDVGETILFMGKPSFMGHATHVSFPNLCPIIACCRPFDLFYGLQNGEAQRLANMVNDLKNEYRKAPENATRCRLLNAPTPTSPMGGGMSVNTSSNGHYYRSSSPPHPGQKEIEHQLL